MSRRLDKQSAEANALRTLDERRAAQAQAQQQARDAARPVPGAGQPAGSQPDSARMPPPNGYGSGPVYGPAPAQAPIIVRQDSGLGHVVAGAIIARSAANAHANNNNNNNNGGYYPAPGGAAGDLANKAGAGSVAGTGAPAAAPGGGSVLGAIVRTFLWLCLLALAGWGLYFAWKRMKSRREANKPNYSFERN
jgi:hypothetical protein